MWKDIASSARPTLWVAGFLKSKRPLNCGHDQNLRPDGLIPSLDDQDLVLELGCQAITTRFPRAATLPRSRGRPLSWKPPVTGSPAPCVEPLHQVALAFLGDPDFAYEGLERGLLLAARQNRPELVQGADRLFVDTLARVAEQPPPWASRQAASPSPSLRRISTGSK